MSMPGLSFDKNAAFSSERLTFRGIQREDAKKLVAWRSQRDVYEVSGQPRPITMHEHLEWFERYMENPNHLRSIITFEADRRDIGVVGGVLEGLDFVLSYYIGERNYRGIGIAPEAIWAFMDFMCRTYGVYKFCAYIKPDNVSSIRCVKKLGFIEGKASGQEYRGAFCQYIKKYDR